MKRIKKQLKAAFILALLKLLAESAAIGCILYNKYQGIKIHLPDYLSYRHLYSPPVHVTSYPYFYFASLLLSCIFLSLFLKFISHRRYNANGSPLFFLKKPAEVPPHAIMRSLNPIRMVRSVWKGKDLQALTHIFLVHLLFCFVAFFALLTFRPQDVGSGSKSLFLQPEFLLPIASILLLLRFLLLCKDLLFSIEEESDREDEHDS